jgi:hypothetical protein
MKNRDCNFYVNIIGICQEPKVILAYSPKTPHSLNLSLSLSLFDQFLKVSRFLIHHSTVKKNDIDKNTHLTYFFPVTLLLCCNSQRLRCFGSVAAFTLLLRLHSLLNFLWLVSYEATAFSSLGDVMLYTRCYEIDVAIWSSAISSSAT